MPLRQTSWELSDATGTSETINIDASNTMIVAASYGTDSSGSPLPITINKSGKSFQFKVLSGNNPLIVTLLSPGPNSDVVYMQQQQGTTVVDLDSFVVYRQEVWDPMVLGT